MGGVLNKVHYFTVILFPEKETLNLKVYNTVKFSVLKIVNESLIRLLRNPKV